MAELTDEADDAGRPDEIDVTSLATIARPGVELPLISNEDGGVADAIFDDNGQLLVSTVCLRCQAQLLSTDCLTEQDRNDFQLQCQAQLFCRRARRSGSCQSCDCLTLESFGTPPAAPDTTRCDGRTVELGCGKKHGNPAPHGSPTNYCSSDGVVPSTLIRCSKAVVGLVVVWWSFWAATQ